MQDPRETTRHVWLEMPESNLADSDRPGTNAYWSPGRDAGIGTESKIGRFAAAESLDVMTIRVEQAEHGALASAIETGAREVPCRCGRRPGVDVLASGTLLKRTFKARRLRDRRTTGGSGAQ